ncbi:hypothetical protein [Williamwhitmania taraxaci]|uniref:hypothetical protein n=1 Tax=Williamwhitmania taraxaci TaxID=1640674 RepID=UPI000B843BBE|nr:hypothetical protein [Williamwhitmania taraxaci]
MEKKQKIKPCLLADPLRPCELKRRSSLRSNSHRFYAPFDLRGPGCAGYGNPAATCKAFYINPPLGFRSDGVAFLQEVHLAALNLYKKGKYFRIMVRSAGL